MTRKAKNKKILARAAVSSGLALAPLHHVLAQSAPQSSPPTTVASVLKEIIVTATGRTSTVEQIPYNISAISADQLSHTGTQDIQQLATQVPGFDMADRGLSNLAGEMPIIRGLNASQTTRPGSVFEQSPVGMYLGNSPLLGYFPLDDVQRIEVLRGPQGTLYGAGALGGAVRIIPNSPKLHTWEADANVSGDTIAHSSSLGYAYSGLLNAPLGEIAAVRLSARHEYDPGFIDQFGIEKRQGNPVTSPPVLANPADVANSPGVYYNAKDVNYTETSSGRASILARPLERLKLELAVNVSRDTGQNEPVDNPDFAGGPWPVDPRITLPPGGDYRYISASVAPYSRSSNLSSLDASYDFGFATLSSTTTYADTHGTNSGDYDPLVLSLPAGFRSYYVGNPINPRFVSAYVFSDAYRVLTEEMRLVSHTHGPLEYTLGLFHQGEHHSIGDDIYLPGTQAQTAASGGLPVITGPNGISYLSDAPGSFTENAIFGEATWNITRKLQLTGGARFFHQNYTQSQNYTLYGFGTTGADAATRTYSDHIFKVNAAYEYAYNQRVYATFSQGFRHGGVNAFPTTGLLLEPASILSYQPDKTNNTELGVKGLLENGIRYTADLFYVDWEHPQIGTFTAVNLWPVVVNAPKARSRGAELELHTPLFVRSLDLTLSYAYVDAQLTQSFCIPNGDGAGGILPCGLTGASGERLPGSPKNSAAATLSYARGLSDSSMLDYSLNVTYKGGMLALLGKKSPYQTPAYTLVNADITYHHDRWSIGLLGRNILDRRVVYSGPLSTNVHFLGSLVNNYVVGQPRTLWLNLAYRFTSEQ